MVIGTVLGELTDGLLGELFLLSTSKKSIVSLRMCWSKSALDRSLTLAYSGFQVGSTEPRLRDQP